MPLFDPAQMSPSEAELMSREARRSIGVAPTVPPAPSGLPPSNAFNENKAPESKRLRPPTITIDLTWTDPDGITRSELLPIRVFSLDERIQVTRKAANAGGATWEQLPAEFRELLLAIATAKVMWRWSTADDRAQVKTQTPLSPELQWAIENDERVAITLYGAVEEHRAGFLLGDTREGAPAPKQPRVDVVAGAGPRS